MKHLKNKTKDLTESWLNHHPKFFFQKTISKVSNAWKTQNTLAKISKSISEVAKLAQSQQQKLLWRYGDLDFFVQLGWTWLEILEAVISNFPNFEYYTAKQWKQWRLLLFGKILLGLMHETDHYLARIWCKWHQFVAWYMYASSLDKDSVVTHSLYSSLNLHLSSWHQNPVFTKKKVKCVSPNHHVSSNWLQNKNSN